jgi:hypothetical protein
MIHPNLLQFLTSEMEAKKVEVIGMTDLKSLLSVERFAAANGRSGQPETVAAAIASIAPESSPERVALHFDPKTGEIFEKLIRVADWVPAFWYPLLSRIVRDGAEDEAFAALAVLTALAETVKNEDHLKELRHQLRMASPTRHATLQSLLTQLTQSVEAKQLAKEVPDPPMTVLSWSIDVAGSTEVKARMRAMAETPEDLSRLYEIYYQQFLSYESDFYSALFGARNGLAGAPLDPGRLFTVKGIGDEIWLLYEVPQKDGDKLRSAIARMIDASLSLVDRSIHCGFGDRGLSAGFDPETELEQRFDQKSLCFKAYGDVVEDGFETSRLRAKYLSDRVFGYLDKKPGPLGPDEFKLLNRLNAGHFEASGVHRYRMAWRTDYIGNDVDRFFRTTKGALAGTMTIGEALFARAGFTTKPIAFPGLYDAHVMVDIAPNAQRWFQGIYYKWSDLEAQSLKGLGISYRVYHIVRKERIFSLHYGVEKDNSILDATRTKFPIDLVDTLSTMKQKMMRKEAEESENPPADQPEA